MFKVFPLIFFSVYLKLEDQLYFKVTWWDRSSREELSDNSPVTMEKKIACWYLDKFPCSLWLFPNINFKDSWKQQHCVISTIKTAIICYFYNENSNNMLFLQGKRKMRNAYVKSSNADSPSSLKTPTSNQVTQIPLAH